MPHHGVLEHDLIIVGGGTSGCVLANRLTEDPGISVLMLETGEDRNDDSRIYTPGLVGIRLAIRRRAFSRHERDQTIENSNGPVQVPLRVAEVSKAWFDTLRTLQLDNRRGPVSGRALGGHTSACHISGDCHQRSHAGVAYLDSILDRPNLTVVTNAFVRKLMIDRTGGPQSVIHGVEYSQHGQILQKLAKTEPLASLIKPGGRRLPEGYPVERVEDAKEFARAFSSTNYHPCGTCSLGTVVDSRLNVQGLRSLKVVDASIITTMPRGNIISTVYSVAGRAADIISEDLSIRRCTALG